MSESAPQRGHWGPVMERPCLYCPYKRAVPSGVWSKEEYDKLREYDQETGEQPQKVFRCHVQNANTPNPRICAGWAGCHDGDELLALRIAVLMGHMTPEEAYAVVAYVSPVPLFSSGNEAADHGIREIENPGPKAQAAIEKIRRMRSDLIWR